MFNHADPESDQPRWLQSHRPRLSLFANDKSKSPDAPVELDASTGGVRAALATWGVEWKRWLDVHLAASIFWRIFPFWPETGQQCSWSDGTCRTLGYVAWPLLISLTSRRWPCARVSRRWRYFFVGKDPSGTSDRFKYALDVDGNAWSARFPRLMASKSLVIKSTAFTEWNANTFPAWYGFIPSQNDYADLESILSLCVRTLPRLSCRTAAD
jgi:beta-1,2-xylosyltransferase